MSQLGSQLLNHPDCWWDVPIGHLRLAKRWKWQAEQWRQARHQGSVISITILFSGNDSDSQGLVSTQPTKSVYMNYTDDTFAYHGICMISFCRLKATVDL